MLKAVLFDMDGVIVDTEPLHRKAYFKMFEEVGIDVSESLYNSFTGQATLPICHTLCSHFSLRAMPEELVKIKRRHFKNLFDFDDSLELIDGVLERIKDYHENGLTLILASSASMPNINRIFKRFELDSYFKAKISGADLKASKPHPEIFIRASELAGEPRENCVVIEDSTNGMKAAKAAGIFCVGFQSPNSKDQDYALADLIVHDFKEISYNRLRAVFN